MAVEKLEGTVRAIDFYSNKLTVSLQDGSQRVLTFEGRDLHTFLPLSPGTAISCTIDGDAITSLD